MSKPVAGGDFPVGMLYKRGPMAYRTLVQGLEEAAHQCGPDVGFTFVPEAGVPGFRGATEPESVYSYTALERTSGHFGGALQALGLRKGDRVALILPSNEDFVLSFFGALRAGLVPVPIYPPLGLGQLQSYLDNTRHIITKAGAKALVTDSRIKKLLGTVQAQCPGLEQIVSIEALRESRESLKPVSISLSDVAFLQFTSGSTSRPKGVCLTHENLAANIQCIMQDGLRSREGEDVGISWLPLYHDMGLIGFVLSPMMSKIPSVFLPALLFLKRPLTWFQAITKHKGTIAYAPNFAYALCVKRIRSTDLEGIDLSTWRVAGCGAEPIRAETLETFAAAFERANFRKQALLPSYGMAESALAISFTELGEGVRTIAVRGADLFGKGIASTVPETDPDAIRLVSCGPQFPGHSVAVYEADDAESKTPLAEGHVGELRLKGPSIMGGYWEDTEKTKEAFAGGWLRTGDLGFLFQGRVYICGRSKEVVIINGRNYYPQDIEWEASKVDGVRKGNVIAFGARDTTGQDVDRERVVVALEAQDPKAVGQAGASRIATDVRKAVQEGMALTLDDVVVLEAGVLPKTSSGKLQRAKTRELYENGELSERTPARKENKIELIKTATMSQLSYFKLAVLGGRKKPS